MADFSDLAIKNEANGKTFYEPVTLRCKGGSSYNAKKTDTTKHQFYFDEFEDYWTINKNEVPVVGVSYILELAVKDSYHDIVSIKPAEDSGREEANAMEDHFEPQGDARDGQHQAETPVAGPAPNPAAVGACANHAMIYIEAGIWPCPPDRDPMSWYCECRDFVFWNGNQVPVMPPNWCYVHGEQFKRGQTGFGHPLGDNYCVLNGGIVDAKGNPVTEPDNG